jgi:hypothetical protein
VTGAAGFIGRSSLEPLRAAGFEVCAVLSPRADAGAALPEIEVRHVDLTDPAAVDALLEAAKPTHLLHFAWIATPGLYWQSEENYRWLSASRHLLAAFGRCWRSARRDGRELCRIRLVARRCVPRALEPARGRGGNGDALCRVQDRHATLARGVRALSRCLDCMGPDILPVRARRAPRPVDRVGDRESARGPRGAVHTRSADQELPARRGRGRCVRGACSRAPCRGPSISVRAIGSPSPSCSSAWRARSAAPICSSSARDPSRPASPPCSCRISGRLLEEVRWSPRWRLDEGLMDTVRWWRARLA